METSNTQHRDAKNISDNFIGVQVLRSNIT